jgi:hypothetical protein
MKNVVILHPKYKAQLEAIQELKLDMESKREAYGRAVDKYTLALTAHATKRHKGGGNAVS